ncbi:MAG TPA: histidine--tRNA ligase [bacterium]|nr:histidine--tRNA ligase [bacterium]
MKFQAIRGVKDILPEEIATWQKVEEVARRLFESYGYSEIRVPIFESTALFSRSIGETTDIVEKEMYSFEDRSGDQITLRPEATASIVRAYIEHRLFDPPGVVKLYCFGPMFRHERPQAGRYRQFYQIDVEAIGGAEPLLDAEMILMASEFLQQVGLEGVQIQLNSLGCPKCRPDYRAALLRFLKEHEESLCQDCRSRIDRNPLRALDCKQEKCKALTEGAPRTVDSLCAECRDHFTQVRELLAAQSAPFVLNPRLVRGLDYYTRTTFEFTSENLGSQNAVLGGGRYDGLIEELGGPSTPAIGFALGMERLTLLLNTLNRGVPAAKLQVYLAPLGNGTRPTVFSMLRDLRRRGLRVESDYEGKSLKSQLRRADRLGAQFVVIVGEDELARGTVPVRDMAGKTQEEVSISALGEFLQRKI